MSDEKNKNSLSVEQQEKALKWLNERWKNQMHCEVCGQKNWDLTGHMVSPLVFHNGGFNLGGSAYPSVAVICKNCANTKYFNSVVMGLVEKKIDGGEDGKK